MEEGLLNLYESRFFITRSLRPLMEHYYTLNLEPCALDLGPFFVLNRPDQPGNDQSLNLGSPFSDLE